MRATGCLWTLGLLLLCGCAAELPPEPTESAVAVGLPAIKNARVPLDGLLSGGQPTPEQIALAADGGFRTVINLRSDGEEGFAWEREAVEAGGMRYVQIPVASAEDLDRATVEKIEGELSRALDDGPVLMHCASGNRIGATLALAAAWLDAAEPEAALEIGRASGLTRLEPDVRKQLGLEPLPTAEPKP